MPRKASFTITRAPRTSLVDNFFNRFRIVSRNLRQVDNYFQPIHDDVEKYLDKQTSRQLPKTFPRCARLVSLQRALLEKLNNIYIQNVSALRARPFSEGIHKKNELYVEKNPRCARLGAISDQI